MEIEITSKRAGVLCAFGLALTLSGGVAWAQGRATPPAQANNAQVPALIVACAKQGTGAMRLSTQSAGCVAGETLVSWNQAGPAGADGKPGISGYEVVKAGSPFTPGSIAAATCPAGKKALGGGYDTDVSGHPGSRFRGTLAVASFPAGGMTSWAVQLNAAQGFDGNGFRTQAYAICALVAG